MGERSRRRERKDRRWVVCMAGVVVVVVVVISEGRYDAGSVGCIDMSMVGGGLSSEGWRYKSRSQGQR